MIEQTVNSIIEAEDEAKRRIAAAEVKAAEILNEGELAAEAMRKQAAADNKKIVAEANAAADSEAKGYAANVDKAVKIILEHV